MYSFEHSTFTTCIVSVLKPERFFSFFPFFFFLRFMEHGPIFHSPCHLNYTPSGRMPNSATSLRTSEMEGMGSMLACLSVVPK